MLIDAHAHLDRYDDETLTAALAEIAQDAILTISTAMDLPSYERAMEIAARCDLVIPTFGVHPWNAPVYAARLGDIRQAVAQAIPPEQLLTETDNPDGLQWLTGVLGMPVRIREVVQQLSELRNTTSEAIIRSVQENLARLMRNDPWLADPYTRFFM